VGSSVWQNVQGAAAECLTQANRASYPEAEFRARLQTEPPGGKFPVFQGIVTTNSLFRRIYSLFRLHREFAVRLWQSQWFFGLFCTENGRALASSLLFSLLPGNPA
jgi:hypothetical protein